MTTTTPELRAGTAPTSSMRIVAQEAAPLSREHKQFNNLIRQLEAKRKQLVLWRQAKDEYLSRRASQYAPLSRKLLQQTIALVHKMDEMLEKPGLTNAERELFQDLISNVAEDVLDEVEDEGIKALYNKHSGSNYDEEKQVAASQVKERFSDIFGMDLSQAEGSTPEELFEHARQTLAKEQSPAGEAHSARVPRKKSPSQLAKEAVQKQQEDSVQLSMREVYRKLVSALHPDRESDATQRARKTALMASVNQAYEKGDLLQLLDLQLELAHIDSNSLATMPVDRLKNYINLLKKQLMDTENEVRSYMMPIRMEFDVPMHVILKPKDVAKFLESDIQAVTDALKQAGQQIEAMQDTKRAKAWLKEYKRQVKEMQRKAEEEGRLLVGDFFYEDAEYF